MYRCPALSKAISFCLDMETLLVEEVTIGLIGFICPFSSVELKNEACGYKLPTAHVHRLGPCCHRHLAGLVREPGPAQSASEVCDTCTPVQPPHRPASSGPVMKSEPSHALGLAAGKCTGRRQVVYPASVLSV